MSSPSRPKFSVVIPIHNKGPHVARSITSVLNQTVRDFELLLIDDASTDDSAREIRTFEDVRIRVLSRDRPGPGGYAARNLGIACSTGKWIAFLDADDEWYPTYLANCLQLSNRFPDSSFLSCGWEIVGSDGVVRLDRYSANNAGGGPRQITFPEYLRLCISDLRPTHTCVACIENNASARDLFPEGRAERGGDQYAWAMYLARCRKMAWSPGIGGIYYKNTVNMVTSTARSMPDLAIDIVDDFAPYVSKREMRLLKKYSNRRMFREWLVHRLVNDVPYRLPSVLHWEHDALYCVSRCLVGMLPLPVLTQLVESRRTNVSNREHTA